MKNRVGQNEIRKFLNEFSYFSDTPMPMHISQKVL